MQIRVLRQVRPLIAVAALTLTLAAGSAEAQYARASIATDGTQANGASLDAALNADGRVVAFVSHATNLVPNDTNGTSDVFVRDLVGNTTTRVSVTSDGQQRDGGSGGAGHVRISDDGQIVVFATEAAFVPEDTQDCLQGCRDIYAHNRATGVTTRVSVATNGTQANGVSREPDLSADGRYVVFLSDATNLVPNDTNGVTDVFLRDLVAGTTTRISEDAAGVGGQSAATLPVISPDASVIGFVATPEAFPGVPDRGALSSCPGAPCTRFYLKTRTTGALARLAPAGYYLSGASFSGDGRSVALVSATPATLTVKRVWTQTVVVASGEPAGGVELVVTLMSSTVDVALSRDGAVIAAMARSTRVVDLRAAALDLLGTWRVSLDATSRRVAFPSTSTLIAGDTNEAADIYVFDRDQDGDGIPNSWETRFGLNPAVADATQDPDGDGLTNLQEFQAGSHPNGRYTRYFAEGATNAFFRTQFAVLNPDEAPASVVLRMEGANGQTRSTSFAGTTRFSAALEPDALAGPPDATYAAILESDRPIAADRLMSWTAELGYGSSLEAGVEQPSTTWYLAEGATGTYSLFYLLQNPGDTDTTVTVDYLRPSPLPVITKSYPVAAHSRFTVDVAGEAAGLAATEVSAKVTAPQPIVVERAMYRSTPDQVFAAGHAGAGVTAPALRWFLAEGATGFFDEYVLIANPGDTLSKVTLTLMPENGAAFTDTVDVAAHSRRTIDLKRYPALASTPVSVIAESTNNTPIVVERAMWWPAGQPYEASLSAGVTSTGTKWAIAGGATGFGRHTYILVANTDATRDGKVNITLVPRNGDAPVTTTLDVPRSGRATLDVSTILPTADFGAIVESQGGLPIVVERSLYQDSAQRLFEAGATSVATSITPVP